MNIEPTSKRNKSKIHQNERAREMVLATKLQLMRILLILCYMCTSADDDDDKTAVTDNKNSKWEGKKEAESIVYRDILPLWYHCVSHYSGFLFLLLIIIAPSRFRFHFQRLSISVLLSLNFSCTHIHTHIFADAPLYFAVPIRSWALLTFNA